MTVCTKNGNVLIYQITNSLLVKLTSEYVTKKNNKYDYVDTSSKGEIMVFTEGNEQVYLLNQEILNSQDV
jgi:hypothetical protein